ncbi:MAG: hypothetical protein JST64_02535 [Actinobacteria bacterium]|nr:hypothetical protein [Actinomycetota bacterium]
MAGRNRRRSSAAGRGGLSEWIADHRASVAVAVGVVVLVVAVAVAKVVADSAASSDTEHRAAQVRQLLHGAGPDDFLAFNAGVRRPGSVAQQVRDQPDFVNVRATADLSFIRFQPDGWWSAFTERCVVAEVRAHSVDVRVPKSACVRVAAPNR